MKWKGLIAIMLCAALFAAGCTGQNAPGTTVAGTQGTTEPVEQFTEPTAAPVEDQLPMIDGSSLRMYYDDRMDISQLGGNAASEVEVSEQNISSTAVDGSGVDPAVVILEDGKLIAVGIGTAVVTVDGKAYNLTVEAAPISLVIITGHSIGAGQCGNGAQSVLCADGTAYSTHYASFVPDMAQGVGLGYTAKNRPEGIDAFTAAGSGTIGEGAAIAKGWHDLTGEKIWVINAAKGGSCLNEWVRYSDNYAKAYNLFRYAQTVLASEIQAGHYRLKDMAMIYHSAANFGYKGVTYTHEAGQKWYDSMWNGFKEDLAMDMDGDGAEETVQAIGFVPIWGESSRKFFEFDKGANMFMASSDAYPDMFMASTVIRQWLAPNGLQQFPAIEYETHGETVEVPNAISAMFAQDGVHHQQVVYNAFGLDIAKNLFAHLRTYVKAESVTFQTPDGNKVYDSITIKKVGGTYELVPILGNEQASDLTYILSENLSMEYPCVIKAEAAGTGTLTVMQNGVVLFTLTVEVKGE